MIISEGDAVYAVNISVELTSRIKSYLKLYRKICNGLHITIDNENFEIVVLGINGYSVKVLIIDYYFHYHKEPAKEYDWNTFEEPSSMGSSYAYYNESKDYTEEGYRTKIISIPLNAIRFDQTEILVKSKKEADVKAELDKLNSEEAEFNKRLKEIALKKELLNK